MNNYIRAEIKLLTQTDVIHFIEKMNQESSDSYIVESEDHRIRVNARSVIGMLYAAAEMGSHIYLVNETNDGVFPNFINEYRP